MKAYTSTATDFPRLPPMRGGTTAIATTTTPLPPLALALEYHRRPSIHLRLFSVPVRKISATALSPITDARLTLSSHHDAARATSAHATTMARRPDLADWPITAMGFPMSCC